MEYILIPAISIIGSIIAALIVANGALKAAKKGAQMTAEASRESVRETLKEQEKHNKERQEEIILGVLQALYEEFSVLWKIVDKETEKYWREYEEGEEDFFNGRIAFSPDFFAIYRSNAHLIGQIDQPPELRAKIVKVYTLFQTLLEGYKNNNRFIDEYNKSGYDKNEEGMRVYINFLKLHAPTLKKGHDEFTIMAECLLKLLENRLSG